MDQLLHKLSRAATATGALAILGAIVLSSLWWLFASFAIFAVGAIIDEIADGYITMANRPDTEE